MGVIPLRAATAVAGANKSSKPNTTSSRQQAAAHQSKQKQTRRPAAAAANQHRTRGVLTGALKVIRRKKSAQRGRGPIPLNVGGYSTVNLDSQKETILRRTVALSCCANKLQLMKSSLATAAPKLANGWLQLPPAWPPAWPWQRARLLHHETNDSTVNVIKAPVRP